MSFENYVRYCNEKRDEVGAPPESRDALERSYRAYLDVIRLSGREVDIRYEKRPDSRIKQIFVPKAVRAE